MLDRSRRQEISRGLLVDDFSTFAQWSNAGGTSFTAADVSHATAGHPLCAKVVTLATTGEAGLNRDLFINGRGKFVSLWILADAKTAQLNVGFSIASATASYSTSRVSFDGALAGGSAATAHTFRPGVWTRICVPLCAMNAAGTSPPFEAAVGDVRSVHIGIKGDGTGTSTVYIADLRVHDSLFPPGFVWIFDDARSSVYDTAYPILSAAGFTGVVAVPTAFVGTTGYMTWEQLLDLQERGWQIVNHTRNHIGLQTTAATVRAEVRNGYADLIANGTDPVGAAFFVWPGGLFDEVSLPIVEAHCTAARTIINHPTDAGKQNYETPVVFDKARLRTVYLTNTVTLAHAKQVVDRLADRHGHAIVTFHRIEATNPGADGAIWLTSDFQELVSYAKSKNLSAYTMSDLFSPA